MCDHAVSASLSLGVALCGTTDGGYDSSEGGAKTASGSEWDMTNTIVYGSNDYTRINPAMDEHGEINALLLTGLQIMMGIIRSFRAWQKLGL